MVLGFIKSILRLIAPWCVLVRLHRLIDLGGCLSRCRYHLDCLMNSPVQGLESCYFKCGRSKPRWHLHRLRLVRLHFKSSRPNHVQSAMRKGQTFSKLLAGSGCYLQKWKIHNTVGLPDPRKLDELERTRFGDFKNQICIKWLHLGTSLWDLTV